MNILNLYLLFIPIVAYTFFNTPRTEYKLNGWYYKLLLIYGAMIFITISIFTEIELIDKYILPFLLFANIAYLIYVTLANDHTFINLLPLIGILYLLYTFDYRDFKIKRGVLVKPNKPWIINYIIVLAIYHLFSNYTIQDERKLLGLVWLVYPLLFPIEEYFIHRAFIISIACALTKWSI